MSAVFTAPFMENRHYERSKGAMDEMKISSKFMKGVMSKIIRGFLKKKYGYDIDICIDEFRITVIEDKAQIRINAGAELSKDELGKILSDVGIN